MSTEQNKAIAKEFSDHFERFEIDQLLAMMTDDMSWWANGKPHLFPGAGLKTKAEIAATWKGLAGLFPGGLKMTPLSMIAEGARVAVELESHGVTKDEKIYNNNYHFVFGFRDGKISMVKEYFDTMHTIEILS